MIISLVLSVLTAVSGFSPQFQPPSRGIGSETAGGGVRAFSMGGVSAGVPDSGMVSIVNPAASAWTARTGLAWGSKFRSTEDPDWADASSFPEVSVIVPLPLGVQFSGILSGRSRLLCEDGITFENGTGNIQWSGSTGESYLGVTVRASRDLAFSIGGRSFFGSALGDGLVELDLPGPYAPISSTFRDDLAFDPSWGLNLGAFMKSGIFSAGASLITDRQGTLSIHRDYMGGGEADTTFSYSVPGELTAGLSARVHPSFLVGVDYFARKSLTLLDSTTGEGSYVAAGFEYLPPLPGFRIRGGYRSIDGLWRDGASRYSGGIGYDIPGGAASIDAGAAWETWSDESETVYFIGLRASENWLGR